MQGKRSGVAKRIQEKASASIPVHCIAHSLNLCLQYARRQVQVLCDAMDVVREIVKPINYSVKRKHLFTSNLLEHKKTANRLNLFALPVGL